MKLPPSPSNNLNQRLFEFDKWITASNGSTKDTEKYAEELKDISEIFEVGGEIFKGFENFEEFDEHKFSAHFLDKFESHHLYKHLLNFSKVLFLVSGKSDNNVKCQFPVYLSQLVDFPGLPIVAKDKLGFREIPRVLTSEVVMQIAAKLNKFDQVQKDFLSLYVKFILNDVSTKSQFWSLGHSYFKLKKINKHLDLLAPLVQFQIRGSVTSTGGHAPENTLRSQMNQWGLTKDIDYNSSDIIVSDLMQFFGATKVKKDQHKKTRAYDFVLPFKTESWTPKIFIQCQFYGGDSGSVSHKNVDQVRNSRNEVLSVINNPIFIEYMDGAGYFSSLNGDLKKILAYEDTFDFIQIKSAPVKLRRVFQQIGFLAPVEIEHAIMMTSGSIEDVTKYLVLNGYDLKEIDRCIRFSTSSGIIVLNDNTLSIHAERLEIAKRYFILDTIVTNGKVLDQGKIAGCLLTPGYSAYFGISLSELSQLISLKHLSKYWKENTSLFKDVEWLCREGYIKAH